MTGTASVNRLGKAPKSGSDMEANKRRFHLTDSGIVGAVRQESLIEEPESA
jgi:hypothetical protein